MARSSGFKINKHLHDLARVLEVNFTENFQEADWIKEIRSIVGKHAPRQAVVNDLNEIYEMESTKDTQLLASTSMTDAPNEPHIMSDQSIFGEANDD